MAVTTDPIPFGDPSKLPETYAALGVGDCLSPAFEDGTLLVFSSTVPVVPGDYIGLWLMPRTEGAAPLRIVKRLVSDGPPGITVSPEVWAASGIEPLVIVEQTNPPREYAFPRSRVMAMHKVLGTATPNPEKPGQAMWTRPKPLAAGVR